MVPFSGASSGISGPISEAHRYPNPEKRSIGIVKSAQHSLDQDVGQNTSMFVQWKRTDGDYDAGLPGKWINDVHVGRLRELWEEHGRPKFPEVARQEIFDIIGESEIKAVRDQIKVIVSRSQSKMKKPDKKRRATKRSSRPSSQHE